MKRRQWSERSKYAPRGGVKAAERLREFPGSPVLAGGHYTEDATMHSLWDWAEEHDLFVGYYNCLYAADVAESIALGNPEDFDALMGGGR